MALEDTKERILDVAERLFGEHGFAGTSLRAITKEAEVNLAAVHYHFGSKEGLLVAALDRYVTPIGEERMKLLDKVEAEAGDAPPSVEAILETHIAPSFRWMYGLGVRGLARVRFLGRMYTDPSETARNLLRGQFDEAQKRYLDAFSRALPHLTVEEIGWRLVFEVGVLTSLMADTGWMEQAAKDSDSAFMEGAIRSMVDFCAAGLMAPSSAFVSRGALMDGGDR